MAIIDSFTCAKDRAWEGAIWMLGIVAKARFVPSDNSQAASSPDHLAICGATWTQRGSTGGHPEYLSVHLDDPAYPTRTPHHCLSKKVGEATNLVWNRRLCAQRGLA